MEENTILLKDICTFVTVFIGFIALIGSNIGLFLWSRSESQNDSRRVESLINAIQTEMKDFHGRLCSLESRWHRLADKNK